MRKKMSIVEGWKRIEFETTPIYVRPDAPDWFVPNREADRALARLLEEGHLSEDVRGLKQRIAGPVEEDYLSRSDQLEMEVLKECWIHITNRCNLKCRHCMFRSSPHAQDELTSAECGRIIDEAYELGSRIYYLTGESPLFPELFTEVYGISWRCRAPMSLFYRI